LPLGEQNNKLSMAVNGLLISKFKDNNKLSMALTGLLISKFKDIISIVILAHTSIRIGLI